MQSNGNVIDHCPRQAGRSGYTLGKLFRLWLNMVVGFSIVPLRMGLVLGVTSALLSLLMLVGIVIDKLWINPQVTVGIPSVLACVVFFSGVQLMILGVIGEYLGRLFLHQNGEPPYIVRYWKRETPQAIARPALVRHRQPHSAVASPDRVEDDR